MGTEADGGTRRVGRYEVELPLGERPLARVFIARDTVLGRRIALKVLRDDLAMPVAERSRLVDRVRERARAFASLSHPVFAALHDMGGEEGGGGPPLYLVFEFIQGPTLSERLAAGPLPPAEVASIGRALGAGLTFAHAAGYVHGDVKPDNVMLALPGPKLTDPGFAQIASERAGTLDPSPDPSPDPFDDQLALAETLYEALTGKRPASGAARLPPSAVAAHLRSFPHLDTIFDRALAESPRKRFTSCEVLGNVLAHEIEGADASSLARASASSIVPRATRRWQNAAAGAAVIVIVALVLLGRRQPLPPAAFSAAASASSAPARTAPPTPGTARPDAGTARPASSSNP
jgi:serine/threonine-protein kinase